MKRLRIATLLFVAAIVMVGAHHRLLSQRSQLPPEMDDLLLPRPSALRAMSLRHTELAADLVFVRALIYFGTEISHVKRAPAESFRWIENYLDTIMTLDPHFKRPYRWASTATMYTGKEITNEAVMSSNRLLARGAEQFPEDWEIPFTLGCNYLFELKTNDRAERDHWNEIGQSWMQRASAKPNVPGWIALLSATLLTRQGKTELAIRHLQEAYLLSQTDEARQQIRNRLLGLMGTQPLELEAEQARFNASWKKEAGYLPADLFVLIGEPPSPRLDWRYLQSQR